jgi:hypothetical protein
MNEAACTCCGHTMQAVAEITPFGSGPGLVAFLCNECGTTDSALVYPRTGARQVEPGFRPEGEP